LQKELKDSDTADAAVVQRVFDEQQAVDPRIAGEAFTATVAQLAQGKSVDVSAITNPAQRKLAGEVKEKAARVKELKKAERAALKEAQALPQGTPERQAAGERRAAIAQERLQAQRDVTALKKRAADLTAESAARVAKTEAQPSRDGLHNPDVVREVDEAALVPERAPEEEIVELREEVDRLKEAEELAPEDLAALEAFKALDERVAATPGVIRSLKACLLRS